MRCCKFRVALAGALLVSITSGGDLVIGPSCELKSPNGALAFVREKRTSGEWNRNRLVTVDVEPGVYRLEEAIKVDSSVGPVAFCGSKGGESVFSGGRDLGTFTNGADGLWHLKVPPETSFEQLWVGELRATRAKSPNDGYFHIMQQVGDLTDPYTGKSFDGFFRAFVMREKEALAPFAGRGLDEMTNVVFRLYWSWDVDISRLRHADPESGRVILNSKAKRNFFRWPKYETRFTLENYRAALDAPGEWYLDRKAHELLYFPRPGERIETARAEIPVLKRLVDVGTDGVRFERIVFAHTAAETWAGTQHTGQSAQSLTDAAVTFSNASHCVMRACEIRATAGYGVQILEGSHSNRIERTHFHDLGAGGVRIGGTSWKKGEAVDRVASFDAVENCIIHDGGKVYPEGTGVLLCQARDCHVTHNEICDLFYSGVCAGWSWGYRETPTRRNLIARNHIHHLGKGVLSDMAGVYTLGISTGTVIRGNHIHDVVNYGYTGSGAEGTYMDEGSTGVLVEENLVHDVGGACLHQNYGRDNLFRNNYLVTRDCSAKPAIRRMGGSYVETNNVIVASSDTSGVARCFAAFDPRKAGVTGDAAWRKKAARIVIPPFEPVVPPARYAGIREYACDYELSKPGSSPNMPFSIIGSCPHNWVRVTTKEHFSGRKCLELREGSPKDGGAKFREYNPHVNAVVDYREDALTVSFALKYEEASDVEFLFRQLATASGRRHVVACGIRASAKRGIELFSRESSRPVRILDSKPGEWLELSFVMRPARAGRPANWDFSLRTADGRLVEKKGLGVRDGECVRPDWIGFLSHGQVGSRFWIDDVRINK